MSRLCEICNCPLTLLRSPREKRIACVSCMEPPPREEPEEVDVRPLASVLRIDAFLKNRRKVNKVQHH